jgi:hypothetical protein
MLRCEILAFRHAASQRSKHLTYVNSYCVLGHNTFYENIVHIMQFGVCGFNRSGG